MANNLLGAIMQMRQNPQQFFQSVGIPAEHMNSPQDAIQYLMNTGRVNQQQYQQAQAMVNQMQNNPMFNGIFKR